MGDDNMNQSELAVMHINEFSQLQKYMLVCDDKTAKAYELMYERYQELKVILSTLGVNTTTIDKINK